MVGNMWRRVFSRRKAKASPQRASKARSPAPAAVPSPAVAHAATETPSLALIDERFHRLVLGLPPPRQDDPLPAEAALLRRLELLGDMTYFVEESSQLSSCG